MREFGIAIRTGLVSLSLNKFKNNYQLMVKGMVNQEIIAKN